MLKLVSSQPDTSAELISQHIADHAPAIALSVLGTINGSVNYDSMKITVTEHLNDLVGVIRPFRLARQPLRINILVPDPST